MQRPHVAMCAAALITALALPGSARAQSGDWQPLATLEEGTRIPVRTTQAINVNTADGRVFTGIVDEDVLDANGRVVIPRGATAELEVRNDSASNLTVDIDSVTVNGQRYGIRADQAAVGTAGTLDRGVESIGTNEKTAKYIGGGAVVGALLGAITGGAKGAAVGAVVGGAAGAGAQIITEGRKVDVPAETLLTFRLQRPLTLGVEDTGWDSEGYHYHRY
jgi:hypothetical protein